MQRYFIKNEQLKDDTAVILKQDAHHIQNVMRFKVGDNIIVCNENENCYKASIKAMINGEVFLQINEELVNSAKPFKTTIAQALIRRERFEYMLQKSTELGVDYIIPTITKNTIIKLKDNKQQSKIDRWNTITKEASEQSHRNTLAKVLDIKNLKELDFNEYDLVVVAYEKENQSSQLKELLSKPYQNILVLIGPEGGFDPKEITFLESKKVEFVGLGPRILRSETASSYILSVLSFVYEMRNR